MKCLFREKRRLIIVGILLVILSMNGCQNEDAAIKEEWSDETMISNGLSQGGMVTPGGMTMPGGNSMPGGSSMPGRGSETGTYPKDGENITKLDADVPMDIKSEDLTSFEISTNFENPAVIPKYSYVYGYASRVDDGALVSLICKDSTKYSQDGTYIKTAIVDESILPELQKIVEKYNFIKNNGYTHFVNGLPGNYGGSADIRYSSGESICFSDNQNPIMDSDAGIEVADLIRRYIDEKTINPLNSKDIVSVRYREDREDGYYDYLLEENKLISENKYDDGEIKLFRNEKEVPQDFMDKIRKIVDDGVLLNWKGLSETPDPVFPDRTRQVIFTLKDGSTHIINSNMKAPKQAGNSVFDIQMYLQNELGK